MNSSYDNLRSALPMEHPCFHSQFHAAVRTAKCEWVTEILIKVPQNDIWGLYKWAARKPPKCIPPLKGPQGLVSHPPKQAHLLASTFFPPNATNNVPTSLPSNPAPRPTRDCPDITTAELLEALKHPSNSSAPGESGTSWYLLRWAIAITPLTFSNLLNACLQLGFHLQCFKTAIIAVIPKPNKPEMSNSNIYCPITLLECLSKLPEKIIAKHIMFEVG